MQTVITSNIKSLLCSSHFIFNQCLASLHEHQLAKEHGPQQLVRLFCETLKKPSPSPVFWCEMIGKSPKFGCEWRPWKSGFSSITMASPSFHRHLEMQKQPITTTPVALANSSRWITRRQAPWEGKWEWAGCWVYPHLNRVFLAVVIFFPKWKKEIKLHRF